MRQKSLVSRVYDNKVSVCGRWHQYQRQIHNANNATRAAWSSFLGGDCEASTSNLFYDAFFDIVPLLWAGTQSSSMQELYDDHERPHIKVHLCLSVGLGLESCLEALSVASDQSNSSNCQCRGQGQHLGPRRPMQNGVPHCKKPQSLDSRRHLNQKMFWQRQVYADVTSSTEPSIPR
jgi:hypothetical protein